MEIGKETKVLLGSQPWAEKRICGNRESSQGFAIKFYTEDGIGILWVTIRFFSLKAAKKSENFIHTQKRDLHTNMESLTMMWDYW
jgi:catalase